MRIVRSTGVVGAPPARVFAVLEDPRLVSGLGPPFLELEATESPWLPKPGERTRFTGRLRGVRFELVTEIAEYRRGAFLLERQAEGPFASLEHAVHLDPDPGGARLTEVLAYRVRLGLLGLAFDRLALRRDLEVVLATRLRRVKELLEAG